MQVSSKMVGVHMPTTLAASHHSACCRAVRSASHGLRSGKGYNNCVPSWKFTSTIHERSSTVVCGTMAQSSPSEFLTFYRTIRTTTTFSQSASRCLVRPAATSRPFSSSIQQYQRDLGPNKDHTVDKAKKDNLNVQTDASRKGSE